MTPAIFTVVSAWTVVEPGTAESRSTVQEPVARIVTQLAALSDPTPLRMAKLIVVPTGALTNPEPSLTFT